MSQHVSASTPATYFSRGLGLTCLLALLTGCVANSSNPEIYASRAVMDNEGATILLQLTNSSGRNLTVHTLQYELSHGEIGFPLVWETWTGKLELPAQGSAELSLSIMFDDELIEDDSNLLHLNGQFEFKDHTGFLWLSSMDLTETSFQIEIEATRKEK